MAETGLVHIVDDDAAVRDSLGFLLETAGLAVRLHASGGNLLATLGDDATGCVITDVRMPGMDGLELQQHLAARGARLQVIVITGHGDVPMAVRALQGGAIDFLEKPFDDSKLLEAVQRALGASRAMSAAAARLARLTAREHEVLRALIGGLGNKDIARALGVSPRTVEVHRARVMEKTAADSLPELIRLALAAGVPAGRGGTV